MLIAVNLGEALRRARGRMTQDELAAATGIDQGTISRWERGQGQPGLDQIRQIEDAAGRRRGFVLIAAGYVSVPATPRAMIETDAELENGYRVLVLSAYDGALASSTAERASMPPTTSRRRKS